MHASDKWISSPGVNLVLFSRLGAAQQRLTPQISELRALVIETTMKQNNFSNEMSQIVADLKDKLDETDSRLNETLWRLKFVEDLSVTNMSSIATASSGSPGLDSSNRQLMLDALEELRQSVKTEMIEALEVLNHSGLGSKMNQSLIEIKASIKKLSLMGKLASKGTQFTLLLGTAQPG